MKKVLVVSDTHGRDRNLKKAIDREAPFDLLFHLGDLQGGEDRLEGMISCPAVMVSGNCDLFTTLPLIRIIQIYGHRILLIHGHQHSVSYGTDLLKKEAISHGCDVVIFGHTHQPMIDLTDPDVRVLNPGSLTYPRQDGREPSYMVIEFMEDGRMREEVYFLQN